MFKNSTQIMEFLKTKFEENIALQYHIVEITETELNKERERDNRQVFETIKG